MPSIKQSSDFLQKAKDENLIIPAPSPIRIPEGHAPDAPTYPEAPNSRLRSPLPASLVQQPDSQRQWHNPSTPQTRLLAATLASSSFSGSAIQSAITTQAAPATAPPTIPVVPVASGFFYEVNGNSNFETMYSINGHIL